MSVFTNKYGATADEADAYVQAVLELLGDLDPVEVLSGLRPAIEHRIKGVREDDLIKPEMDFAFYGPTCDDADYMQGPFVLPEDIQASDYIEIGMLGAYGAAMKTDFNGFGAAERIVVQDEPMASLYDGSRQRPAADNVVSLR